MKGKSLRERLEPGFMLETSRGKIITVYAMPPVSYKFSGRFWSLDLHIGRKFLTFLVNI